MPELRSKIGALTPKLEQVIHTLEWVLIESLSNLHGADAGVQSMAVRCWLMPLLRKRH